MADTAPAREGAVRVEETDPAAFLQHVSSADGLAFAADEPVAAGGRGKGPSPYQLLAAGLGACTSMTIRMYARRKDLPLEHVAVEVSHDRIHARDCADCPEAPAMVDLFHRVIRLDGPLDADQRARLMEIADRCPVHRTLTGTIRIHTELVGA